MSEYDVFLSYPRTSVTEVKLITEMLKAEGLRVWLDERDIDDFTSITDAINKGLMNAKVVLAYYALAYPTRRACQWELTTAYTASLREGIPSRRILVVNPETTWDHVQPMDLRDALGKGLPVFSDRDAIQKLAEAVRSRVTVIQSAFGDIRPLKQPRQIGYEFTGYTRFVGRFQTMWQIHTELNRAGIAPLAGHGNAVVVHGLGGSGKSLLAEEYALRFSAAYPGGMFWLRAYGNNDKNPFLTGDQLDEVRNQQLRECAKYLGFPVEEFDVARVKGVLAAHIEQAGESCLWVVDDLPNGLAPDKVKQWFAPHPLAKTLITTRSGDYGDMGISGQVKLGVLEPKEAYELLQRHGLRLNDADERAAHLLFEDLGHHALAIDVAAGSLKAAEDEWTFESFREHLNDPSEDVLELVAELGPALPNRTERSIAALLLRTIEHLPDDAKDVLRVASLLAPAPIPSSLLKGAMRKVTEGKALTAEIRFISALKLLDRLSLIDQTDASGSRRVHPLVIRTMLYANDDPDRTNLIQQSTEQIIIDEAHKSNLSGSSGSLIALQPHLRHLADVASSRTHGLERAAHLCSELAYHLGEIGDFAGALNYHQRALDLYRDILGDIHPYAVVALTNVGTSLRAMGNYEKAYPLLQHALEIREKDPESNPADVAGSLNELGLLFRKQGDYAEALRHYFDAYDILKEAAPDHKGTDLILATTLNNLGLLLSSLGHRDEAQKYLEQALSIREDKLGKEHLETATTLNNLGGLFDSQGDHKGAKHHYSQALSILEEVAPKHPYTATTLVNLGGLSESQGEYKTAKIHYAKAITILEYVAPESLETATTYYSLANMLRIEEDLQGAQENYERSLKALESRFLEHHYTQYVRNALEELIEWRSFSEDRHS